MCPSIYVYISLHTYIYILHLHCQFCFYIHRMCKECFAVTSEWAVFKCIFLLRAGSCQCQNCGFSPTITGKGFAWLPQDSFPNDRQCLRRIHFGCIACRPCLLCPTGADNVERGTQQSETATTAPVSLVPLMFAGNCISWRHFAAVAVRSDKRRLWFVWYVCANSI